ncbi:hypothetical protein EJ110_NYTH33570 [Nymphaea thermarum]|nr:hypothetical protein EJ110_NYTH33570 [Nymphaea thermarum]
MVETLHTGERLASVINDCLLKWNIDCKCAAHILNLVVQNGVKEIKAFGRFQELDRHYHLILTKDKWKKATIIHNNLKIFYNAIAVVFYPHYKMKIIEFYYKQFYKDEACEYVSAIKNYLCDLTLSTGIDYTFDVEKDSDTSSFTSFLEFLLINSLEYMH